MTIRIDQLVDFLFVAVLCGACLRALYLAERASKAKSSAWKKELQALHSSLAELINEAAAQSERLGTELSRYKSELEQTLSGSPSHHNKRRTSVAPLDVPNETWLTPSKRSSSLESAAERTKDTVSIKSRPKSIHERVEKIRVTRQRPESVDLEPAALKIATRLLREGRSLNTVAAKLDVPLAKIRTLASVLDLHPEQASAENTVEDEQVQGPLAAKVKSQELGLGIL